MGADFRCPGSFSLSRCTSPTSAFAPYKNPRSYSRSKSNRQSNCRFIAQSAVHTAKFTMSHAPLGIAEAIQGASIKRHPSPRHDINPATAASEKVPYEEVDPSETASISSDILDRPILRPVPRRRDLPPLPDLRFEQSYLASLRGAETWQRIAWITVRDQVNNSSIPSLSCQLSPAKSNKMVPRL